VQRLKASHMRLEVHGAEYDCSSAMLMWLIRKVAFRIRGFWLTPVLGCQ
jgi:hypothetical protein